jgi:hypothetical protein
VVRFHTRRHVLVVAVAAVLGLVTTSCSSHRSAFCRALDHGDPGFQSPSVAARLHAIDRVIAALPARDRADIKAVRSFIAITSGTERTSPKQQEASLVHLLAAIESLDPRLRDECHVPVPEYKVPTTVAKP